eukprot:g15991.t1
MNFGVDLFRLYEEHKKALESAGDYETAETTARRLTKMREAERKRQVERLLERQKREWEELQCAQLEEKGAMVARERAEVEALLKKEEETRSSTNPNNHTQERLNPTLLTTGASGVGSSSKQEGPQREQLGECAAGGNGGIGSESAVLRPTSQILELQARLKHVVQQGLYGKAREISHEIDKLKKEQAEKVLILANAFALLQKRHLKAGQAVAARHREERAKLNISEPDAGSVGEGG